ncbi:tRNA epoxyqueuosine(34) reductase QueG [soil metagenome]
MLNPSAKLHYSNIIKNEAKRLGFEQVGFAPAGFLEDEAPRLESWLSKGFHGQMKWMENHFDMRLDPTKLVPGAKSVISLMFNYFPSNIINNENAPKVAKYAYGEDYHFVLKDKLKDLMHYIQSEVGEVNGRVFVDSAPIMERKWAQQAGLGWIGKNTLLLNKGRGSYYFLAEIICDLELEYDGPVTDHCGTCTACIDACPTDAITPYEVDATKCISYLTIELKDAIPNEFAGKMENWAFGCDICQEVCPWNRFATPHAEPAFNPSPEMANMTASDWHEITEEVFKRVFKNSPIKRTKFEGLQRNLSFLRSENREI